MLTNQCMDCGALVSLGPSNDEPDAVRIEIDAASLAADTDWSHFDTLHSCKTAAADCARCDTIRLAFEIAEACAQ